MLNDEGINARIRRIEAAFKQLEKIKDMEKDTFLTRPFVSDAAERNLHVVIEGILDLANSLAGKKGRRSPESYADIFAVLHESKLLSSELTQEGEEMARFRNLLVHGYATIDKNKIYEILQTKLTTLSQLLQKIVSSLENQT